MRGRRRSAPTPAARADQYITTDADSARQEAARKHQDAEIAAAVEQIKARIGPDAAHFIRWMQRSRNFQHAAVSLAATFARLDADFTDSDAHLKHNYLGELMRVVDSGRGSVDDVLKHWQRRTRKR